MGLSNISLAIIEAYEKGYRADEDGTIVSHLGNELSLIEDACGRLRFSIKASFYGDQAAVIPVHRFVAFIKYGDKIFEDGVQVRHLDNNCKNNSFSNIAIGTQSQNMMDRPEKDRVEHARNAASYLRLFADSEVIELRKMMRFLSMTKIARVYGCSKSTLSYIKNRKTYRHI